MHVLHAVLTVQSNCVRLAHCILSRDSCAKSNLLKQQDDSTLKVFVSFNSYVLYSMYMCSSALILIAYSIGNNLLLLRLWHPLTYICSNVIGTSCIGC